MKSHVVRGAEILKNFTMIENVAFVGDYKGKDPYDEADIIDLNEGYCEIEKIEMD